MDFTQLIEIKNMLSEHLVTIIVAALGGGGIVALVNALSKHFLTKDKQDDAWTQLEFTRLENRIIKLEKDNEECNKNNAQLQREIGELMGQVNGLMSIINRLEGGNVVGVIVCDSDMIITEWNQGASFLFHWSKKEAIGQKVSMLVPPRLRGLHASAFAKAVSEHREPLDVTKIRETYALTRDGTEIPITITLSGWSVDGKNMYSAEIKRR